MSVVLARQAQKATDAMRQGRYAVALKIAKAVLKSDPKQGFFANLAGLASVQASDPAGAVPYFRAAIRADAHQIDAHRNLAQALIQAGAPQKALKGLETARQFWPTDAALLYLIASAHHAAGQPEATVAAVDTCMQTSAPTASLHTLRALALEAGGDSPAAEADFRAALALAPHDAEVICALAEFLARHGRGTDAATLIAQGLDLMPDHTGLLLQRANLEQAEGRSAVACATYERVLASKPDNPFALNGLAYLADPAAHSDLTTRIARQLRAGTVAPGVKMLLGFAQAELARRSEAAEAPRLLAEANARAARIMPYDATADARTNDHLLAPFLSGAAAPSADPTPPRPVFIVGLIRSGTTLTEQVLAAHPTVAGLGELTRARHLASADAAAFADAGTPPDGAQFARHYRDALPPLPEGTTHFVDKMPDNFRVIGHILNAFPDAVVIEMQRDPRDVALSMWATLFPTTAHSYANTLPDMAAHMNLYARTMQQWHQLFPGRIQALAYADLVTDLRKTSCWLADLCGLDWQEAMLHPEQSSARVMTASAQQVRQAVHTGSLGKWRTQTDFLAPFTAALDPDLWPQQRNLA